MTSVERPVYAIVGHDVPRVDAVAKVTGAVQYAGEKMPAFENTSGYWNRA